MTRRNGIQATVDGIDGDIELVTMFADSSIGADLQMHQRELDALRERRAAILNGASARDIAARVAS